MALTLVDAEAKITYICIYYILTSTFVFMIYSRYLNEGHMCFDCYNILITMFVTISSFNPSVDTYFFSNFVKHRISILLSNFSPITQNLIQWIVAITNDLLQSPFWKGTSRHVQELLLHTYGKLFLCRGVRLATCLSNGILKRCPISSRCVLNMVFCTGCLRKKYGVADYQYFKNGNTQQCNIFWHNKCNFCLVACEISTPYVKCNKSYKLEKNDGSNGT